MKSGYFNNKRSIVATTLMAFLLVGFQNCSPAHFTSNSMANNATTSGTTPTPAPTPACGQTGMTQVTLLTPSVLNAQSGNYIDYQLSLQTCDGQPLTFNNVPLLFDINAVILGFYPLQYSVTDGQSTFSGILADDQGSDLFGDTGSTYGHWSTDTLNFSTAASSVVLRIFLMGQTYLPNQTQYYNQTTATANYVIPTYISIGSSLAATQNVNFNLH